jgi:hypothetical protein
MRVKVRKAERACGILHADWHVAEVLRFSSCY